MMFYNVHHHRHHGESPSEFPPAWTPAPEKSYRHGLRNEASEAHFEAAKRFCSERPLEQPRLLDSRVVDDIQTRGSAVWGLVPPGPFVGTVNNQFEMQNGGLVTKVKTRGDQDDCCLLSNLPIVAGQYHIPLTGGVYYEITVREMEGYDSIIAIGTACRPYPPFRLPGWNRLSAALHLDDLRKFFEDPYGGRDYAKGIKVSRGDVVGCGYEFYTGAIFFTYQGRRLPDAFRGIYLPPQKYDVYAAVGVSGATEFTVNFGGDTFRWLPGNEWDWKLDRHVGQLTERNQEELPPYSA